MLSFVSVEAQQLAPLTVEKIMRDPKWIGVAPSNFFWSEDGKQIYFQWNPEKLQGDSLYLVSLTNLTPAKVSPTVRRRLPSFGQYNQTKTKKVFEKNGDVFLLDILNNKTIQITNSVERESNPSFSFDEKKIMFIVSSNLFSWAIGDGSFAQLTDFRKGTKKQAVASTFQTKHGSGSPASSYFLCGFQSFQRMV